MSTTTPGGGAVAPATLNVKQSDALGYQYALLYKMFDKFAPYIDHIISWGVAGSGWQGSYVLFDSQSNANAGYYGAANPDRFILGHSYLDKFYEGEYEKIQSNTIDLGDLGIYTPRGPVNENLNLSGLTLSAGTLQPAFSEAITEYTVSLQDANSMNVIATAADHRTTLKANGAVVVSGTASEAISLTPGITTDIKIEVTASDGTVRTYTIKVLNSKTGTPSIPSNPSIPSTPGPASPVIRDETVTKKPTVKNGATFTMTFDLAKAKELLAKNAVIDVPVEHGVNSYTVGLPAAALTNGTKNEKLTISTELGAFVLMGNMLTGITEGSKGVTLEIAKATSLSSRRK